MNTLNTFNEAPKHQNGIKMVRSNVRSKGVRGYKTYTKADVLKAVRLVKSGSLSLRKASARYRISLGTSNKYRDKFTCPIIHPTVLVPVPVVQMSRTSLSKSSILVYECGSHLITPSSDSWQSLVCPKVVA